MVKHFLAMTAVNKSLQVKKKQKTQKVRPEKAIMMIKPTTEPSPVFRRPIEQTIAAVDTLKTSFLPNLNTDSIISNYCPICGQSFSRQNLLAEHMQLNHHSAGVLFATQLSSGTSKIEFPCLSCDEKFSSGFDLDEHNRITHQTFLTRCISCGLYGMSSPSGNLIDGGEYKCQHCGAISSATMIVGQHTYVDQHMQHFVVGESENDTVIVTTETQEKSPEPSPKVPPLTVKLNKTKNATGIVIKQEPPANSNEASSESLFLQHSTLDSTSNNRTRHKCPDCPRSFKTTGTLAKHRKIHTGETDLTPKDRPYTCTYCGKSFTQSNTLKQHIRIHTGEKPYRCGYCGRAFTVKDYLNKHITTHTGEKPFTCSYCEKSFSVKDYLTKHIRTHTGEKPYQCPYCDKRFTQRSALTVHATKLHPVQQ